MGFGNLQSNRSTLISLCVERVCVQQQLVVGEVRTGAATGIIITWQAAEAPRLITNEKWTVEGKRSSITHSHNDIHRVICCRNHFTRVTIYSADVLHPDRKKENENKSSTRSPIIFFDLFPRVVCFVFLCHPRRHKNWKLELTETQTLFVCFFFCTWRDSEIQEMTQRWRITRASVVCFAWTSKFGTPIEIWQESKTVVYTCGVGNKPAFKIRKGGSGAIT